MITLFHFYQDACTFVWEIIMTVEIHFSVILSRMIFLLCYGVLREMNWYIRICLKWLQRQSNMPWHGKHFFTSCSAICSSSFLAWQTLTGNSCSLSISVSVDSQNKSENWNSCKWKVWNIPYHCYLSNMAAAFCSEKQCVSLSPFPLASLEHTLRGLALSNDKCFVQCS